MNDDFGVEIDKVVIEKTLYPVYRKDGILFYLRNGKYLSIDSDLSKSLLSFKKFYSINKE